MTAAVFAAPVALGQIGAPAGPFDPRGTLPVEALKADLQALWDILEEGHGGLDRYAPAETLKRAFDDARNGLTGPLTEIDLYGRLLPLIAAIQDGHTRLSLSEGAAAYIDAKPVHFPFALRILGDRVHILGNLSGDRGVGEGDEVLSIDGRPMREIIETLLPLVPADAGIRTAKLRRLEDPAAFGLLYAVRFGMPEAFRVRLRSFASGKTVEVAMPGITAGDIARIPGERHPAAAGRRPNYELSFRGSTAVLTIRAFGDDQDKSRPAFPAFLAETFRSLEEKKTPGLVIDLRGNGGGFDEYGKMLFAHVADRPFLYYWAMEAKKDRYDLFRYTGETAESAAELARPLRKNAAGRYDVVGHPNRGLQMPRAPHFAGRVAVLIDGGSRSTAGETVSAFHFYKKAVFFGEEGGAGYYGNTACLVLATLPHSRIRVSVPLVRTTMAVDGYPGDRGLVPDFPVAPAIGELLAGRDPVLERALACLERK